MNGTAGINHQWILEQVTTTTSSMSAKQEITSAVYPNPCKTRENLTINLPENGNYELQIVNTDGLTIQHQTVKGEKLQFQPQI